MTLLSRVLGFLRDVAFAVLFGAGAGMDAFLVAFKIPNFMRRLFAEGAFAQSFVPVLAETKSQQGETEVKALVDVVAGTLGLVLLAITVIGVVAAPALILMFAPGFLGEENQYSQAVTLLRVTFPYLFFISLTAFAGGILNTYGRFAVPAFTPVLLNVCLIGAAVFAAPYFADPTMALAVGVFIAGAAQLGFQLPFLARIGMLPRPRWGWSNPKVRSILNRMMPILFGSSVAQVNLMLDTIIASALATGSVSWLYFSDRLMEFPLGIFSIAIATVILPGLSAHHGQKSTQAFSDTLDWALKLLIVVGTPAMVGLFVLAGPLVVTLFYYRSFEVLDVMMSRYSLMAYAFGFMGFSLVKILLPGFYARGDTRTPVRCGVISVVCAMVMNLTFVGLMLLLSLPGPHAGLALATSMGAFVNAILLYRNLRKADVYRPGAHWLRLFSQVTLASLLMGAVLWSLAGPLNAWLAWSAVHRAGMLLGLIGAGVVIYFIVLLVLGMRPRHLIVSGDSTPTS